MAETNRNPSDFVEVESELVSVFNVEYGGGGLALIFFFADYAIILFISLLFCVYNVYRVFPGSKAAGAWRRPPTPTHSSEVKERVELYPYSPSAPSWPVLGRSLPLPLPFKASLQKIRHSRITEHSTETWTWH